MALRVAVDANRYVDFARGEERAVAIIRQASELFLPFIVLGELRAGFRYGERAVANEAQLTEFVQCNRVRILLADQQTTHVYADLLAQLRRAGTPIPTNDLWIAALVIQHGLVLFTRDRHFDCIPQLARI